MSLVSTVVCVMASLPPLFVLAELTARAWRRSKGDFVWRPFERTLMHLDREALPNLPALVRFEINCDGERGGKPPGSTESVWRVLVAGGSAAECYLLDQADSWPEVLANELLDRAFLTKVGRDKVHMGNIGKSGVDTSCVKLIFDRILRRYHRIDCILLFIGAGDVVNWLCSGAPTPFHPATPEAGKVFSSLSAGIFGWTIKRTALAEVARNLRDRFSLQSRSGVGKKLAEVRLMRANASIVIEQLPDPSGMIGSFAANLRDILQAAKGKADKVLVIRQPWFDKDHFTAEEERLLWHAPKGRPYEEQVDTYFSYQVFNALMRAIDLKTVEICDELGIAALDLKAALPNSVETYYDHLHFTATGSKRVGKAVADFVKNATAGMESNRGSVSP